MANPTARDIECPYCGCKFEGEIPKHDIPDFSDERGEWICFGSPQEPTQ